MKIGFVLECSLNGPDATIYPDVLKKLCGEAYFLKPKTLGNKRELLSEGHIWVQEFLNQGCDYVFMIWDRKPGWGGNANCDEDKQTIMANLNLLNVPVAKVRLCCIDEMLESWLIADSRGINQLVEKLAHPHPTLPMADNKSNAEQADPCNKISRHFKQNKLRGFTSFIHSKLIYEYLSDLVKARKWNVSFNEYCIFIEEICP
jgi:hypothetical protein